MCASHCYKMLKAFAEASDGIKLLVMLLLVKALIKDNFCLNRSFAFNPA